MVKTTFFVVNGRAARASVLDLDDSFERLMRMLPKNRQH